MLAVLLLSRMSIINAKRRASRREKAAKAEKLDCDTPEDVYCRTCLGTERLMPLFEGESDEKRSHDLKTVTGLEIKKNDGLSQQICSQCTDVMNQALQFRRRSRKTEKALLNMCSGVKSKKKYSRRLHKSIEKNTKMKETKTEKLDMDDHYYDSYDYQNCDDYYDVPVLEEKRKIKQKLPSIKKKRMSLPTTSSYKCSTCSKEFRMKATYKAHMRFHTNYCVCESCGKRCRNNNQLQEHKRARHGLGRIHKCAYCEYSSATKEALTCDMCPKKLKSRKFLQIHKHNAHTGKRYGYLCSICDHRFEKPNKVRAHTRRVHGLADDQQGPIVRVQL